MSPTTTAPITVRNAAELASAMARATGGETILLAGGHYGSLTLGTQGISTAAFAGTVTLQAADPGDPPVITGLSMSGARNVTFDGLTFDYSFRSSDALGRTLASLTNCSGITFRNAVFDGDDARGTGDLSRDGYPNGLGLGLSYSQDIRIEDSTIRGFWKGITIDRSSRVTLTGNEFVDLRSDGIGLAQITDVTIEGNHIHDFRTSDLSGDHADMIQMWTGGTTQPSSGLTIRGNVLDIGQGGLTQMVFLEPTSATLTPSGLPSTFRNILIEDNVLIGSHVHGIRVGATNGLTIRNNTVLAPEEDDGLPAPRIMLDDASTGVVVTANVTEDPILFQGKALAGNFRVQNTDPDRPGHYGDSFFNAAAASDDPLANLQVRPDSALAAAGAGSRLLAYDPDPDRLTALIAHDDDGAPNAFRFDGQYSAGPAGAVLPLGARFLWDFGDGQTGEGGMVRHVYAAPGHYEALLTVVMPDGGQTASRTIVHVPSPDVLTFDPASGRLLANAFGEDSTVYDAIRHGGTASGPDGVPLRIDAAHVVTVQRKAIAPLFGAEEFRLAGEIRTDSPGELLRQHMVLVVSVLSGGEIRVELTTETGITTRLTTAGAGLTDGAWHDFEILYDGNGGGLRIAVDGAERGAVALSGALPPAQNWNLTLGRSDSRGFAGDLGHFELDVEASQFAAPDPAPASPGMAVPDPGLPDMAAPPAPPPDPELALAFGHDGPAAAGGTGSFLDADGSGTLTAGDTVTFTYSLTNTGNVALTDISLADSLTGASAALLAGLTDTDGDGLADDLAVGASASASLGHVIGAGTGGSTLSALVSAASAETATATAATSLDIARTITGQIEAGVVTLSQADGTQWTSVTFAHSIADARVVFGPLSAGGKDPAGIRVRNVTDQGFEVQIDEWDYLDGKHAAETLSWLAVSAGSHVLASGQVISAGRSDAVDSLSQTVALTGFAAAPAIFAQVSSAAGAEAVTTRVSGVGQSGFSVHLQEEEANDGLHAAETIDWVAIDYGTTGETDVAQATLTHRWKALAFDPQTDEFAFIAGMQTENQTDTALLRHSGLTGSGVRLMIEEETSLDSEVAHAGETVAYLTLETGFLDLYA